MERAGDWRPSASRDALKLRADLYAMLRAHFARTGAMEVETPLLSACGTTDVHIESFSTRFNGHVDAGSKTRWMRTSPEFAMKRLLAAGIGDCYELGRVFRDGEAGQRHNPEFTMLEWYRVGWTLADLIDETAGILSGAMQLCSQPLVRRDLTYRALYLAVLGLDPLRATDAELIAAASDIRVDPAGLTRDDWLDLLFTHKIQATFAPDALTVVRDFPASQCALAKVQADAEGDPVAQRFEIYIGPLEMANGYDELVDAAEQARRQQADASVRSARGIPGPPADTRLVAALQSGLPACSGVAVGIDRLLMAMQRTDSIASVIAFNFQRA